MLKRLSASDNCRADGMPLRPQDTVAASTAATANMRIKDFFPMIVFKISLYIGYKNTTFLLIPYRLNVKKRKCPYFFSGFLGGFRIC